MRQLLPISMPQWYRGFDPIEVPWEEPRPGQLPDILGLVQGNAQRASAYQNPDGSWNWPWQLPDEEKPKDDDEQGLPVPNLPSPEDQPPADEPGSGGNADIPVVSEEPGPWIPPEGIAGAGSGGYTDQPPPSVGFEPDTGAIWGGVGAIWGGIGGASGPAQLMPGDLPIPGTGIDVGRSAGGLANWTARLNAIGDIANFQENPRGAFTGAVTLANPLAGALAGGFLALGDVLNNKGASARQDERDYYNQRGAAYYDSLLPYFWTDALGRESDWIYGNRKGTGQADADWLAGFQSWLGSEGVGGRPETPFQNFGRLSPQEAGPAIADALWQYMQINPIERGMGPGDFAPLAQLDRLYGTQDNSRYYDLNSLGWEGLGLAMETLPNRIEAGRGLESDPAWQQWVSEFSQLRPNVALPQAGSYIDPRMADYWDWIEQNRQNMGMGG